MNLGADSAEQPLLDPSEFLAVVSGRRRGARAGLLRGLFSLAEAPYAICVRWRNRRYDRGKAAVHRVDVPVVSVGNVTTGGVGKTPMVEWLARWFRQRGVRVVLISRGYGAEAGGRNDEALELEQKLPDAPHLQNPDRVAAAQTAIEELDGQLIVLDDAFQHRRIRRDLDIVLIDALAPFGYGRLLPRGLLREPLSGLARADVVALSRADAVTDSVKAALRSQVRQFAPSAAWLEVAHQPVCLLSSADVEEDIGALAGRRIAAFCGIGNPRGFRHTLESCNFVLADFRVFPDHHAYSRDDIQSLSQWAAALDDVAAVLCTHKDLVKIGLPRLGPRPLWALRVAMKVLAGQDELEAALQLLLKQEQPKESEQEPPKKP